MTFLARPESEKDQDYRRRRDQPHEQRGRDEPAQINFEGKDIGRGNDGEN